MNKQSQQNLLVGFTALLSLTAAVVTFRFIGGKLNHDKSIKVVFPNVLGVQTGVDVQMAGVRIGQVDAVQLTPDNQGQLTLGIRREFEIPKEARFIIRSKVLGNTSSVEVVPPKVSTGNIVEGATVVGESQQPIEATLSESQKTLAESRELIKQGEQLVATMNAFIGNPQRQRNLDRLIANSANVTDKLNSRLTNTLDNTEVMTRNLRRVSEQLPEIKMQVDVLLADLRSVSASGRRAAQGVEGLTGDARTLTQGISGLVKDNRKALASVVQNADEAASSVAGLTAELKNIISDKKLRENLATTTDNIEATTANLATITAKFDKAADNLQKLTGDQKLNADLRDTVTNLRETTASFRNLAARVEKLRLPGERREATPTNNGNGASAPRARTFFSTTSLLEPGLTFDSLYDTERDRLRVDTNFSLLAGKRGQFYRVGVFDTGESNRLNLQLGQAGGLPANFDYRYGIIAGKLGLGFDLRTGPFDWRLDMYDPNYGTANARTRVNFNRSSSLTLGIDSIGRQNRATFGLQFRR